MRNEPVTSSVLSRLDIPPPAPPLRLLSASNDERATPSPSFFRWRAHPHRLRHHPRHRSAARGDRAVPDVAGRQPGAVAAQRRCPARSQGLDRDGLPHGAETVVVNGEVRERLFTSPEQAFAAAELRERLLMAARACARQEAGRGHRRGAQRRHRDRPHGEPDRHPAIAVAGGLTGSSTGGIPFATPEIAIYKNTRQRGYASVAFVAFRADTGEYVTSSGRISAGRSATISGCSASARARSETSDTESRSDFATTECP